MPRNHLTNHLEYLLTCYFHEDWELDAETWEGVVATFVTSEPALSAPIGLMGELSILIESSIIDDARFQQQFSFRNWPPDNRSIKSWLGPLREQVGNELAATGRLPATAVDDVMSRLEVVGLGPAAGDVGGAQTLAKLHGECAPMDEVIGLLGSASAVLSSLAADPDTKDWLETIRAAVASTAAERWPPTS